MNDALKIDDYRKALAAKDREIAALRRELAAKHPRFQEYWDQIAALREALTQAELDMVAALANHEACREIWASGPPAPNKLLGDAIKRLEAFAVTQTDTDRDIRTVINSLKGPIRREKLIEKIANEFAAEYKLDVRMRAIVMGAVRIGVIETVRGTMFIPDMSPSRRLAIEAHWGLEGTTR